MATSSAPLHLDPRRISPTADISPLPASRGSGHPHAQLFERLSQLNDLPGTLARDRPTAASANSDMEVHRKDFLFPSPVERHCGHSGQETRARREPARIGRGPSPAQCGRSQAVSMIRNMRGMILGVRGMSDRVQAGRPHNSLDCRDGLRGCERRFESCWRRRSIHSNLGPNDHVRSLSYHFANCYWLNGTEA